MRLWERGGKQRIKMRGFGRIRRDGITVGKEETNERKVFEMEDC
jgi:hypothetical protein